MATPETLTQNGWLIEFRISADGVGFRRRIELLKIAQDASGREFAMPRQYLRQNRSSFVTRHVQRKEFPMAPQCWACSEARTSSKEFHRHHVVALRNWGSNRRLNLVTLCKACHFDIHPWMAVREAQGLRDAEERLAEILGR